MSISHFIHCQHLYITLEFLFRVHMQRFQMGEDTVHFCLRVMVGVIILYDHVHPAGAFCKGSRIDVSIVHYKEIFAIPD